MKMYLFPALLALVFAVVFAACEEEPTAAPDGATAPSGDTDAADDAEPTATPVPFSPITASGVGDSVTETYALPAGLYSINLLHDGARNFIVYAYPSADREDLLVNEIGSHSGRSLLAGGDSYQFEITADGTWSFAIEAVSAGGSATVSGAGDHVSSLFEGSGRTTLTITHDGDANFVVWLHCSDSGTDLVVNEIGAYSGSSIVDASGTCLYEIEANGSWTITAG